MSTTVSSTSPSSSLSLSDLFHSTDPAAVALPNLITILDGELIGKVSSLTRSRPGLWPLPAPFNEEDFYNEQREGAPFSDWGLMLNQAEVQGVGRMAKEALFGANLLLVDSAIDQAGLTTLAQTQGQRLENGAWFTPGYHELPTLPQVVELGGWALIPVGPGRSRALFVTSPARAEWIGKLREWCDRQGRDTWQLQRTGPEIRVVHQAAPAAARINAVRHRVDAFLGEMDLWFGLADESLPPLVQERIEAMRKLRESISRVKPQPQTPCG